MKLKVSISMNYVGCHKQDIINIPDEELEGLTKRDREQIFDELYDEWAANQVDGGWEEVE